MGVEGEQRGEAAATFAARDDAEEVEARLDEALEETFPASDPVSIDVRPPAPVPASAAVDGAGRR